jgi:hypothetical protein
VMATVNGHLETAFEGSLRRGLVAISALAA